MILFVSGATATVRKWRQVGHPDGTAVPAGTAVYTELIVDDPALDGGVRW